MICWKLSSFPAQALFQVMRSIESRPRPPARYFPGLWVSKKPMRSFWSPDPMPSCASRETKLLRWSLPRFRLCPKDWTRASASLNLQTFWLFYRHSNEPGQDLCPLGPFGAPGEIRFASNELIFVGAGEG